jgi:anti-sigma factor RsiW
MNKRMLGLMVKSLDGELTAVERLDMNAALAESAELRDELARLVAVREAVAASGRTSFGPFFAERVMHRIRTEGRAAREESFLGALFSAFRPVAIAAAAVVVGLAIYNSTRTDDVSVAGALGVPQVTLEEIMEPPVETVLEAS